MGDNPSYFSFNGKSPLNQLFISLMIILVVGTFLFTGFLLAGTKIFDIDFGNWGDLVSKNIDEDSSRFMRFLLISQDISFLIIPGIIILILMKPVPKVSLSDLKLPPVNEIALVIILAICIFPITSLTNLPIMVFPIQITRL